MGLSRETRVRAGFGHLYPELRPGWDAAQNAARRLADRLLARQGYAALLKAGCWRTSTSSFGAARASGPGAGSAVCATDAGRAGAPYVRAPSRRRAVRGLRQPAAGLRPGREHVVADRPGRRAALLPGPDPGRRTHHLAHSSSANRRRNVARKSVTQSSAKPFPACILRVPSHLVSPVGCGLRPHEGNQTLQCIDHPPAAADPSLAIDRPAGPTFAGHASLCQLAIV